MPDAPLDGGVGTPTPAPTPAAAPVAPVTPPPVQATPAPAAPVVTPAAPQAPPVAPGGDPTQPQAPGAMVPSYRLRQTREQAAQWARAQVENAKGEHQRQLDERDSRIRALAGVSQPENAENEAVKQQFAQLFPGLAKLNDPALADKLLKYEENNQMMAKQLQMLRARDSHYWDSHTRTAISSLFTAVEKGIGGQLSDEAKRAIHGSFVGYVRTNPQVAERYTRNPQGVVNEYWSTLQTSLIDPVRRTQQAGLQNVPPVVAPKDDPSGTPAVSPAPKLKTMRDRSNAAWQILQQAK